MYVVAKPRSLRVEEPPPENSAMMFAPDRYRARAAEYSALAKATDAPREIREFEKRERAMTALADNEQWLADNHDKTVHGPEQQSADGLRLEADDEHILRCLGAALIMRWNTLPRELQRELFDDAGTMGEMSDATALRGQIARFLHSHKDDENEAGTSPFPVGA
jgi:hypothetical protein